MMKRSLLVFLAFGSTALAQEESSSLFLKEILQGRCYFAPPFQAEDDVCPAVVGSFMNILESHLDADIVASFFDSYLEQADLASPPDKALFYLKFFGRNEDSFVTPPGYVSPEDTPGGAMWKNVVFCGVDQQENCSIENSNAYWKFWEAVYARFALQVQGHVSIVLEPLADIQFLQRSAIANLRDGMVSSVTIYHADAGDGNSSGSCTSLSHEIEMLTKALKEAGIDEVTCKEDVVELYVGDKSSDGTETADTASKAQEQEEEEEEEPKNDKVDTEEPKQVEAEEEKQDTAAPPKKEDNKTVDFFDKATSNHDEASMQHSLHMVYLCCILGFFLGVLLALYCPFDGHHHFDDKTGGMVHATRNMCSASWCAAKEAWTNAWRTVTNVFTSNENQHGTTNDVVVTENSPLVMDGEHHDFFLESGSGDTTHQVVLQ